MRRGRPAHQVDPDESHAARLGAEIRARRCEQALTLAQLASRIGFSQQHLSEVERGRAPASSSFVSAVDHVLAANGELLELLGSHSDGIRAAAPRRDARARVAAGLA